MKTPVVHDQGAVLRAEIESLRYVLELKSKENAALRSEVAIFKRDMEDKHALQLRLDTVEARCEDLKAQLQCKDKFERQVSHENEMLHESIKEISKQNERLAQRNEELQWRLRERKNVSVVANQLAGPRLSRSAGPQHTESSALLSDKSDSHSSSMVKFMVEKGHSVSWTLEIDDESSKGAASVTRARSKKISVTDATRAEENGWSPPFSSTPIKRRRPRNNDASTSSSSSSSSASSSAPGANPTVWPRKTAASAGTNPRRLAGKR